MNGMNCCYGSKPRSQQLLARPFLTFFLFAGTGAEVRIAVCVWITCVMGPIIISISYVGATIHSGRQGLTYFSGVRIPILSIVPLLIISVFFLQPTAPPSIVGLPGTPSNAKRCEAVSCIVGNALTSLPFFGTTVITISRRVAATAR